VHLRAPLTRVCPALSASRFAPGTFHRRRWLRHVVFYTAQVEGFGHVEFEQSETDRVPDLVVPKGQETLQEVVDAVDRLAIAYPDLLITLQSSDL
jgi:hypothetical protein